MNITCKTAIISLLATLGAGCATVGHEHSASATRQEEVARRGSTVMPFELSRTTHFFDANSNGGIQTITANDQRDAEQVALIRSHLSTEAQQFGRGDFSDPAAIHGKDMPGLAVLSKAGNKLHVAYKELPAGASLTYTSQDPAVVTAIHDWFAAQSADHGAHDHMHHQMHH